MTGMAAKKKPSRSADVSIQFYADAATAEAFSAYLDSRPEDEKPSRKSVLVTALRDYLRKKDFWPPAGMPDSDPK